MAGGAHPWLQQLKAAEAHANAGRLADAEAVLRQILSADPDQAEALNALAALAAAADQLDTAIALQERAVAARPNAPVYRSNLGEMYRRAGKFEAAIEQGRRAVALRADYAAGHNNLGVSCSDANELEAALASFDAALALKPDFAEAHNNRGVALRALGRLEEAEAALRRALTLRAAYAEAHNNLALALKEQGKLREAAAAAEEVLSAAPDNADVLVCLAMIRLEQQQNPAALDIARRAQTLAPEHAEAANALGMALAAAGRQEEAVAAFKRATRKRGFADPWSNLGTALKELGRFDEAIDAFDHARRLAPRASAPLFGLAEAKRFKDGADPHLVAMESLAADIASLPPRDRIALHFALSKAYDDLGRADDAFRHWDAGSALKRRETVYDESEALNLFDRVKRAFDARRLSGSQAGSSERTPIFIIGMPRSGTTLVEQILSSHPQVAAAGEISAMNDAVGARPGFPESIAALEDRDLARLGETYVVALRALAGQPGERITDKTPSNMHFVGFIHLAMQNAAVIHVQRDPVDTCLSCYSKLFVRGQGQTYDLGELGRYYRAYHDLMRHWDDVLPAGRILNVRYEDVVADVETQARRLLEYCGLAWDDRVLAFHENARAVSTASARQVREPIYKSSVARWRRYETHLTPLLDALGDLAGVTK